MRKHRPYSAPEPRLSEVEDEAHNERQDRDVEEVPQDGGEEEVDRGEEEADGRDDEGEGM